MTLRAKFVAFGCFLGALCLIDLGLGGVLFGIGAGGCIFLWASRGDPLFPTGDAR